MKRRDFLAAAAATTTVAATGALSGCSDHGESRMPKPPQAVMGPDGVQRLPWQNWSGYRHCLPGARVAPNTVDEMAEFLKLAKTTVRPVGAGHSFTELVPTDGGILVSLRNFSGLLSHDAAALTATFGSGTRLGDVGEPLDKVGQAMPNMPDIDEQTLAGAMSTGTHGTGQKLGALHSQLKALKLVTPKGDVLTCSGTENPEIFDAARVSLGSLGVIVEYTMQNVASHKLKRKVWLEKLDTLIEQFDELAAKHHSFEFYYLPFCDYAAAIAIDPTDDPIIPRANEQDDNALMDMRKLRDVLEWWPGMRRFLLNKATQGFHPEESVDTWYKIFPSNRPTRFNEMEYHLPREQLMPTLKKVRETLESKHREIFFPIEIRTVKGDNAMLSPFYGHETSGSIAVHHYYEEDPLPYFADIEPIYQPLAGRPHWGKMNTLDSKVFAERYPRWKDFLAVREALDPEGKMLNPYLKKVFGLG